MYEFSLNINNDSQTISPTAGFGISALAPLLSGLSAVTDPGDDSFCSLFRVDNHGYTPHFTTDSKARYERFVNVHRNLAELKAKELSKEEHDYVNTLKKVLKGRYLEPYDRNRRLIAHIEPDHIGINNVDTYQVITTVQGIIRQIGGKNLTKGTHIMLDTVPYRILTTPQQDKALGVYYKGARIQMRVRQKCSIADGHVQYAVLLDYYTHSNLTLLEGLNQLKNNPINRIF